MKKFVLVMVLMTSSAFAQVASKVCAVAYNSLDANYTSKMAIVAGASMPELNKLQVNTGGNWDNRISKVDVVAGCTFIGYQYQDFNVHYNNGRDLNGFALVLSNSGRTSLKTTVLGAENEKISSLKCFCNN